MGPAAICSSGTDTYRPLERCVPTLLCITRWWYGHGGASLANVALCYRRRRYIAVRADMYRRQRYTSLPDRYVAPAICTASLTDMKQGRYVAPQRVICSALGAISAVCHAQTLSSLQRPLPNAERRVPEAHRHVPRRARRRQRRRLLGGVGGGDSQRRAPARRRVAGAGR